MRVSLILDDHQKIIEASKGSEVILEVLPEECQDRSLAEVAPELFPLVRGLIERAAKGRPVEGYTIRFRWDGHLAPVTVSAIPYPLTSLGIHGILLSFEAELAAGEPGAGSPDQSELPLLPRLEALDHLAEGVFVSDRRGYISYANPALALITGYERDSLSGVPLTSLLSSAHEREMIDRVLEMLPRAGWDGELELRRADGKLIPVLASLQAVDDTPPGVTGVVRDISGWRAQQGSRDAILHRLYGIVEGAPPPLACITEDFHVTLWNRSAAERFGLEADRVIGSDLRDALPDIDWSVFSTALKRQADGPAPPAELALPAEDGGTVETLRLTPLPDVAGRPREWLLAIEGEREGHPAVASPNVTPSLSSEREVDRLLDKLERQESATCELTQTAAMEMREPLTAIKAYAIMLREGWDSLESGEAVTLLERIDASSHYLELLLGQLSSVRELHVGEPARLTRVDMPELAREVVNSLHIPADRYRVVISFPPAFPEITSDAEKLRQVFYRLIENAVRYSVEGGYIGVSGRVVGDRVVISVRDRGVGMERDKLREVFRRLHVLPSGELMEEMQGLRLGLYLCKRYLKELGGELWAESVVGQGTTVFFSLPADNAE
ncbi:MAG: sensor histidine kinase [Candidatus Geothermincolia bacterium]